MAAVIRRNGADPFLAVKRPPEDDRLPNIWGLPAVTLARGELPEAALRRVGVEKLGVRIEPLQMLGIGTLDRGDQVLILMDIGARLVEGEPDVTRATTNATRYVDQCWTDDPGILVEGAAHGSLCCRILLDAYGIPY